MSSRSDERVVRAACPHDCPDTCAMLVTVDETGRATRVAGDPDHPVTAGFLCGKVSNYLDRVYAEDRLLDPLIREGAKGDGRFRRASWDDALDLVAVRLGAAIARHSSTRSEPATWCARSVPMQAGSGCWRRMACRPRSTPSCGRRRATWCVGAGTRCRPRRIYGGSFSLRVAQARGSWSSIPSAAGPLASRTSTSGPSLGRMRPWRSG
jgi:anaerobic selenocysteine-containing dehydrogenase